MKQITNQRGGVLLACVIIGLLIMAAIVQYANWTSQMTRDNVQQLARQKALINADTGIQAAYQYLRSPQGGGIGPGDTVRLSNLTEGSTYFLSLTRQLADTTRIDIVSTGYYLIPRGSFTDPNGNPAQQAVVLAQVQLRNIGDYFAATPDTLDIAYGSNISSGVIYGKDLRFTPPGMAGPPGTRIMAAYYYNTVTPANYTDYVTFLTPDQPVRLGVEPNLPTLGPGLRNEYFGMAPPGDHLAAESTLYGSVAAPSNGYKVYYSEGNLHLGVVGSSFTVQSSMLIYSLGNIYIHNIVNGELGDAAWPALLAEGNIYIAADAPPKMKINATLISGNDIRALGSSRGTSAELEIKGGLIAGKKIIFSDIYGGPRTFTYQAPDPVLPLPNSTTVTLYKVSQGKFNR